MKSTIPPGLPSTTFSFLIFVILHVIVFFAVPLLLLLTLPLCVILSLLPFPSILLSLFALLLNICLYHPGQPMCHGKAPHMVPLAAPTTNLVALASTTMGAHPAAPHWHQHVDGLGHGHFAKAAANKVHCQSNMVPVWAPPEGPASGVRVENGVQEDKRPHRMQPGPRTSHLAHLEGHPVDAIRPTR